MQSACCCQFACLKRDLRCTQIVYQSYPLISLSSSANRLDVVRRLRQEGRQRQARKQLTVQVQFAAVTSPVETPTFRLLLLAGPAS